MSENIVVEPDLTAEEQATADASAGYTGENIKVLKDAEHIRTRPGMYIGDTGSKGLHHLVYELVHNSVDEALAGFCRNIHVKINVDRSVSVSDDGRGIPVDVDPETGKSALELVMTIVGAGGKFDKGAYKTSSGLHGMGAKAVVALSEWSEAQVQRGGRTYTQEYQRGKAITPVKEVGASKRTGTRVTFRADPTIFHEIAFDYGTFEIRLRELAFLNKGLGIKLTDDVAIKEEVFKYDGGLAEFVSYLNRGEDVLHAEPISIDKTIDSTHPERGVEKIRVEVAIQYTKSDNERVRCYTNNAYNQNGGTHLTGFRDALTRSLKAYGTKQNLFPKDLTPIGEDFREGLTAIVSIQHPEPQFDSQTKGALNNREVESVVSGAVSEFLNRYLEENPKEAKLLVKQAVTAAEAREAAAKARQNLKARKGLGRDAGMPGKLMDCTAKNRDICELFIVEGDSAGGSAESGRNREFQAVLPLRGKPLNVEKARVENLLKNAEICSLIKAVGIDIDVGLTQEEREKLLDGLRYARIIILTDADVDGQHIRTLLLTFFYRQMPALVAKGHVFVARPPLYKVTEKKKVSFVQTAEKIQEDLTSRALTSAVLQVHPRPAPQQDPPQPSAEPRKIEGKELAKLLEVLEPLEKAIETLERRGVNLPKFLSKESDRGLPVYRVMIGVREKWCYTSEEVDAVRESERAKLGHDLVVEDVPGATGNGRPTADTFSEEEWHEVRHLNRGIAELKHFGLESQDLVPQMHVAGRAPPLRLKLEAGEQVKVVAHLRALVAEVRKLGEKGMSITRFKGLGEMNPEELWETTLDPSKRTLLKVELDDALKADEMFRTLMGEKVEPRRDFITKYALEVKDIDYHGA